MPNETPTPTPEDLQKILDEVLITFDSIQTPDQREEIAIVFFAIFKELPAAIVPYLVMKKDEAQFDKDLEQIRQSSNQAQIIEIARTGLSENQIKTAMSELVADAFLAAQAGMQHLLTAEQQHQIQQAIVIRLANLSNPTGGNV